MNIIRPQAGFQEAFLSSPADIAIGGGAAGAGKSYALLMEPLRFVNYADFSSVFFRRTYPEIMNPGGLWDTATRLYPDVGARPSDMDWRFRSGAKVVFRHLQRESDIYSWQGTQIPLIGFDELTHFTAPQFWYLLSRNRNPHPNGIRPYIRATCNPDPDSFVAELVEWFIDQDEQSPRYGYPIPERCGRLRYFTRDGDALVWGDTEAEVIGKAPHLFTGELAGTRPKSLTFIPGDIYSNKALLSSDPGYLANLMAQSEEEKERLLRGNWKVRTDGLNLYDPVAVSGIVTNYPPAGQGRYITGDVARFGHDWTVLMAWHGWEVVELVVMKENDSPEAVRAIEALRQRHQVPAHHVLVDQNGVGGAVLQLRPDYRGFLNNAAALPDPTVGGAKENYYNLKTQCYYRSADRVNAGGVKVTLNDDTVSVYDTAPAASGGMNHVISRGCRTKLGGKIVDVRDLLKADLRAIRKHDPDHEGKKRISTKEEQKILLGGRSPDFGDCLMMREWFELSPAPLTIRTRR